jgi:iron(III) transport system ATP-binding protein
MSVILENVTKVFEDLRRPGGVVIAVDGMQLEVKDGELVTLLGPSGCGKTTALRLVAGFETPTSGRVLMDGQDVTHQPPHARNSAMVFQSYAIFPHLTVAQNVAFGLEMRSVPGDQIASRVRDILELVELSGLEHRSPEQLSGGQQQRVALARAIITEPRVLLFDEPLSNLDAKLREQMRGEVRKLQHRLGITSIYVTHDQAEAMALSDRIVVMEGGRVQQVGAPLDIYAHPANRFVADFIGRVNFLEGLVKAVTSDGLEIDIGGRSIKAPSRPTDFRVGEPAAVVVRPETIRLGPVTGVGAASGPYTGTIRRATYLGATAEYEIDWKGSTLLAVSYSPLEHGLFSEGTQVAFDFPAGTVHALPSSGLPTGGSSGIRA